MLRQVWQWRCAYKTSTSRSTIWSNAYKPYFFECGRAQATLSPTALQTDQDAFLLGLLKAIASSLGNNFSVRQSPACSSQSQGSIERFHRTLIGQVRALIQQVSTSYKLTTSNLRPIVPSGMLHIYSIDMQYAVMVKHAFKDVGTKTKSYHYVKWQKRYNT